MQINAAILAALIALSLALGLLTGVTHVALAVDDNVTVDVNVTPLTEITVTPVAINWTQITPGTAGGYRLLDIKNTGSVNVTNIYSFVTTLANETYRPYATSDAVNYSATGVLLFQNETNTVNYWAGRLEWNWTEPINNLVYPSEIDAGSRVAAGFFRNASFSFVFAIGNGSNATGGYAAGTTLCNSTGAEFAIEDDRDDGSADTRSPTVTTITRDSGDTDWSYFSISRASNLLNGQCVAVYKDCTKLYFYNYDKRSNMTSCLNSEFIHPSPLVPNDIHRVNATVWVPLGTPAGNLASGIWTFVAS